MIISTEQLLIQYSEYRDPHHKIQSLVKKGFLFPLKRGMFETDNTVSGYMLAGSIHGPSYLSFEFALSYYRMIPERVTVYTSAALNNRKRLVYHNGFGIFEYRDIPEEAYPHGYTLIDSKPYPVLIATREKALCDELSILKPIRGKNDFSDYLFNGMRLDEEEFEDLDFKLLNKLAAKYHRTNLYQLIDLIGRKQQA